MQSTCRIVDMTTALRWNAHHGSGQCDVMAIGNGMADAGAAEMGWACVDMWTRRSIGRQGVADGVVMSGADGVTGREMD